MICIWTVYTQSPADKIFHIYFKFTYFPYSFDAFETEVQRPGKESTYLSLLSDCLLSPKRDVPDLDPDSE